MSYVPDPDATKQRTEFTAWGMPVIYLLTASAVFAAFLPHFRANAGYLKLHIAGYVGKLSVFAAVNIICSIFLFWSPAINYALVNFLLNFMILCTISMPAFPKLLAKNFALSFFIWMLVYCGVAPSGAGGAATGVINSISATGCVTYYSNVASVTDKICKDGWVTFTLFCAIITIGLSFLANLILISVAFDPSLQGEDESTKVDGGDNYSATAANANPYQNPTVGASGLASEGAYQSYQNSDNNA